MSDRESSSRIMSRQQQPKKASSRGTNSLARSPAANVTSSTALRRSRSAAGDAPSDIGHNNNARRREDEKEESPSHLTIGGGSGRAAILLLVGFLTARLFLLLAPIVLSYIQTRQCFSVGAQAVAFFPCGWEDKLKLMLGDIVSDEDICLALLALSVCTTVWKCGGVV